MKTKERTRLKNLKEMFAKGKLSLNFDNIFETPEDGIMIKFRIYQADKFLGVASFPATDINKRLGHFISKE